MGEVPVSYGRGTPVRQVGTQRTLSPFNLFVKAMLSQMRGEEDDHAEIMKKVRGPLPLSLSHTHTLSLSLTHTHPPSISLSHTHPPSISLSHTHP